MIFILLAAIFKAISDTLADHFYVSIFRNMNPKFWSKEQSADAKRLPFTQYPFNAWHLSNSAMILSFCLAFVLHDSPMAWYYELAISGVLFIAVFNLFYNTILKA
jgi:hypothetical protein